MKKQEQTKKTRGLSLIKMGPVIKSVLKSVAKGTLIGTLKSERLRKRLFTRPVCRKIGDGAYMLTQLFIFNSYLFTGKKRALLVDTGIGLGGLREAVLEITDKPVTAVVTHGHPSSVFGAGAFEEVLVSAEDLKTAEFFSKIIYGKLFLSLLERLPDGNFFKENFIRGCGNFVPLDKKKKAFELGGREIGILPVPSHTSGSLCFTDDKGKIVLTGHVTTPLMLLLQGSVRIDLCKKSFELLLKKLEGKKNYSGFFPTPLSAEGTESLNSLLGDAEDAGNDYSKLLRFRAAYGKKRALLYFPARTQRGTRRERFVALFKKPERVVW